MNGYESDVKAENSIIITEMNKITPITDNNRFLKYLRSYFVSGNIRFR